MASIKNGKHETEKDSELLEQRHFQHVIDSFMFYHTSSMQQLERKMKSLKNLSKKHQIMLGTLHKRFIATTAAIDKNYDFIKNVVQVAGGMFENSSLNGSVARNESNSLITGDDMDRVRTTIRQCVRDWAEEGKEEREQSYSPILNELDKLFPQDMLHRCSVTVLVPGAGLGRLMFEIANRGFQCQGNEFSLYMLFTSNYLLNLCDEVNSIKIHPWIHQTSNVFSINDQLREVTMPDVNPRQLVCNNGFSMTAGDFLQIYTDNESWDCVSMCFFLDTAHNIIEYIEKVYNILKPGGYWINFGPLLYHFADIPNEPSIELTYDEVKDIILKQFNFTFIKENTHMKSGYVSNPRSMLSMTYDCVFFVVQKPFKL